MTCDVTIAEVRAKLGIDSNIVSDATVQENIDLTISNVESFLRINCVPRQTIEVIKADTNPQQQLRRKYPLKILSLQIGTRVVDVKTIYLDWISGLLSFKPSAQQSYFTTKRTDRIKIKYLNGFMQKDEEIISEIETSDISAGDNVVVTVSDITGLSVDDYVMFESLDGSLEAAKITVVGVSDITVDKLVNDYEIGSLVTKLETDETLRQYILLETAYACGANSIGASYTFNTSYTIEGVTTNKGVPYPHFEKVVNELKQERDRQWTFLQNKLISIA